MAKRIIKFPKCHFCNNYFEDGFKCKQCKHFTCMNCFRGYTEDGDCVHVEYKEAVNRGW